MALPNMVVTGNLKEVLGDVVSSELVESALSRARISFTSNVPNDAFVKWDGSLYRVMPVQAIVNSDGDIVLDDGEESPVRLLAQDDGLDIRGLQWQVRIDIPSNVLPSAPSGRMRSFWFGALGDGETINLKAVSPTLQSPLTGTEVLVPASIDDLGGVSPFGKTLVGSSVSAAARSLLQVRRSHPAPDSNGTDDTIAMQALVADGGEIVLQKGGTWTVDANPTGGMLTPPSNTRIIIEEGATLKVKTNALALYYLFNLDGVTNVQIEGMGTLLGDAPLHTGSTGQYGHLINITNGSTDCRVMGPLKLTHAWGDAIYVGGGLTAVNEDILIDGVIIDDCRREGISPFWVDGCTIRRCRITNIASTQFVPGGPGAGIDVEPNDGQWVTNLTIENNYIAGTAGNGMYISTLPAGGVAPYTTKVAIRNNRVADCGIAASGASSASGPSGFQNGIYVRDIDDVVVVGNVVDNIGFTGDTGFVSTGIKSNLCDRPVIKDNYVSGSKGAGILVTGGTQPEIVGNTVRVSAQRGISTGATAAVIENNRLFDNNQSGGSGEHHLSISGDGCSVDGNLFRGSNGNSWVRISSGSDNRVAGNIGLGPSPTNKVSDAGTLTRFSRNERVDTGVYELWTASDRADVAVATHAATAKTTPVDADEFLGADSAASFAGKKFTWANIKTTLAAWLGLLPSGTTLAIHNQADQTTNYERARHYWSSDTYTIATEAGGSGTARPISIQAGVGGSIAAFASTQTQTIGTVRLRANLSAANGTIAGVNGTLSATSGVQFGLAIVPTFTQTSTAGYTTLLINSTETTVGSGAKLLADFQANSVSKAKIDNNGVVTAVAFGTGLTSTTSAATTTVLTLASNGIQVITGSTTQIFTLPTTGLLAGHTFRFINNSSGAVTINSSGANLVKTLAAGASTIVTALVATPTTAANWHAT